MPASPWAMEVPAVSAKNPMLISLAILLFAIPDVL
jgi:hypothetical protein